MVVTVAREEVEETQVKQVTEATVVAQMEAKVVKTEMDLTLAQVVLVAKPVHLTVVTVALLLLARVALLTAAKEGRQVKEALLMEVRVELAALKERTEAGHLVAWAVLLRVDQEELAAPQVMAARRAAVQEEMQALVELLKVPMVVTAAYLTVAMVELEATVLQRSSREELAAPEVMEATLMVELEALA